MARYRFHATNGSACVFDAVGRDVRRLDRSGRRVPAQPFVRHTDAVARAA